ncbi:hypothetical protein D3C71_406370 [compost metagenome]
MTTQNSYRIWLKLVIAHDYFDAEQCGVILEPDRITSYLLQKAGILFKQQTTCSWVLIAENDVNLDPDDKLSFQLKAKHPDFYYYTNQAASNTEDCVIIDYQKEGIWKKIALPVSEDRLNNADTETVEIQLGIPEKQIEFLVFPSPTYPMEPLEIREQRGKVVFKNAEESTIPGTNQKIFRFVSAEALPLKYKSAYQFHLWELRKSGDNLLSRLPDFPLIQSLSPFSPKDTITSYIYL